MRILFGFEVLVENACDPDLDYLDFNKEIKEALEKVSEDGN
jgi:ketol-acid reductoisomerase